MSLILPAFAYVILQTLIVRADGPESVLARAIKAGGDWKGKLSPVLYVSAIVLAFVSSWLAVAIYAFVALIWLVPDRRIERILTANETPTHE